MSSSFAGSAAATRVAIVALGLSLALPGAAVLLAESPPAALLHMAQFVPAASGGAVCVENPQPDWICVDPLGDDPCPEEPFVCAEVFRESDAWVAVSVFGNASSCDLCSPPGAAVSVFGNASCTYLCVAWSVMGDATCETTAGFGCLPVAAFSVAGDASCSTAWGQDTGILSLLPQYCGWLGAGAVSVLGDASAECTGTGHFGECGTFGVGAASAAGDATCVSSDDNSCGAVGVGAASGTGSATCNSSGVRSCGHGAVIPGIGAMSVAGDASCESSGNQSCGGRNDGGIGNDAGNDGYGAISILGDASCSGPGNSCKAISVMGHTQCGASPNCVGGGDVLRPFLCAGLVCADWTGDAEQEFAGVSGTGNARCWSLCVAASGFGDALAEDGNFNVALAGKDADGFVAVAGRDGDAGWVDTFGGDVRGVAIAGRDAAGMVAVAGTGNATAPCGTPCDETTGLAASGTGNATGGIAASGTGDADGTGWAASLTGDANGSVAVSVTGHASGGIAVSGCDTASELCV